MNNADLIVRLLKNAGITHGFGVPSGNVLPLMESMRSGGIEFVLTAHEGSAGFAADVMARATGRPGLAIATLGPGATNLATGVGNAWLDRSPLIAITCTLVQAQLGRRIQMWIDHHTLFKPITKASVRIVPGRVTEIVNEALRIAMTEPVGPVHLDLPEDVAVAECLEAVPPPGSGAPSPTRLTPPADAALAQATALIAGARRPIAVIGTTAMRMRSPDVLRDLVERHNMPFATTTMAKGLIDEDHPLSVGCIERAKRKVQRPFLQSADLIVGIGYDTIEVEYEAWAGKTPVLNIDIQHADVDPGVKLVHEAVGDLDITVARLAQAPRGESTWSAAEVTAHREAFQRALRPAVPGFAPHQAIDAVRRLLPRDGILSFDVGAHTHQIASQWTTHAPRTFHITNGWSSMGFGLPGAIAAKLADPARPVVCLIGDGCFQMTCGEVAVIRRLGLAIPIVVLDDRWLSLIKVKQERRNLPYYGTETLPETPAGYIEPPAHYFGVPAVGVRTPEALERELRKALAEKSAIIIEAVVDSAHYSDTVYD